MAKTYRLTEWAKTREPLYRVPWRDLTESELREAGGKILVERGYFEEVDAPDDKPARTRRPQSSEPAAEAAQEEETP